MANYASSGVAKGQAVVTSRNNAPEQRRKIPTVMELALKNQEYSIPNANELRKSELRPVEIYYQKTWRLVIPLLKHLTTPVLMAIAER
ncbi:MAG: hypothetical protein IPJ81_18065 [Chitinophagaceae bacterium]|nr:hypothetical protein [Chitinophagaceae bacterium]